MTTLGIAHNVSIGAPSLTLLHVITHGVQVGFGRQPTRRPPPPESLIQHALGALHSAEIVLAITFLYGFNTPFTYAALGRLYLVEIGMSRRCQGKGDPNTEHSIDARHVH